MTYAADRLMQPTVIDPDDLTGVVICFPCQTVTVDTVGSLCPRCFRPLEES